MKLQKFSLRVLLSFCLVFYQSQPGVAYDSVAYKKMCTIILKMFQKTNRALCSKACRFDHVGLLKNLLLLIGPGFIHPCFISRVKLYKLLGAVIQFFRGRTSYDVLFVLLPRPSPFINVMKVL